MRQMLSGEAAFDLELDPHPVAPGENLRGRLILGIDEIKGPLTVSLVRWVDSSGGPYAGSANHSRLTCDSMVIDSAMSSGVVPFQLMVPADAQPGFTTRSSTVGSPTIDRGWLVVAESTGRTEFSKREAAVEILPLPPVDIRESEWRSAGLSESFTDTFASPLAAAVLAILGPAITLGALFADSESAAIMLIAGLLLTGLAAVRLKDATLMPLTTRRSAPVLEVCTTSANRGEVVRVRAAVASDQWEVRLVCLERYATKTGSKGGNVTQSATRELEVVHHAVVAGVGAREYELVVPERAFLTSVWGPASVYWRIALMPRRAAAIEVGSRVAPLEVLG